MALFVLRSVRRASPSAAAFWRWKRELLAIKLVEHDTTFAWKAKSVVLRHAHGLHALGMACCGWLYVGWYEASALATVLAISMQAVTAHVGR